MELPPNPANTEPTPTKALVDVLYEYADVNYSWEEFSAKCVALVTREDMDYFYADFYQAQDISNFYTEFIAARLGPEHVGRALIDSKATYYECKGYDVIKIIVLSNDETEKEYFIKIDLSNGPDDTLGFEESVWLCDYDHFNRYGEIDKKRPKVLKKKRKLTQNEIEGIKIDLTWTIRRIYAIF